MLGKFNVRLGFSIKLSKLKSVGAEKSNACTANKELIKQKTRPFKRDSKLTREFDHGDGETSKISLGDSNKKL